MKGIDKPENLTLPPYFGSGMLIQQGTPFSLRGCALPGAEVTIHLISNTCRNQVDENGAWRVILEPVPAGGPYTITIESGREKIILHDVYSGDVWLCSGQSNMEMQMDRLADDYPEEWNVQDFPPIHQFKVPQEWDFSVPRKDIHGGSWISASKETLHEFQAAAWFFAKNMYAKYRRPIGLIAAAWGGTPVESWMSREALAGFPEKIALGDQYADPALCGETAAKTGTAIEEWEKRLLREDKGLAEGWQRPHTDVSGWDTLELPGDFAASGFCGVIWLCREFHVTAGFAAEKAKIWLGTIIDADTVYINGVETGNTAYRYPPRKYTIPAGLLHEGKNRIVIRVSCFNGGGGITRGKPFRVFTDTESVELAGTWRYKTGLDAPPRPAEFFFQYQPMGAFNAMIAPLLQFPFKGVIWYQGESNGGNPGDYAVLFKSMIQDWRRKSERELPFIFVQLPVFGEAEENNEEISWAFIRDAQCAALSLPSAGMAAALDLGEWNELHPVNKKDIGYRLFLAADKTVFHCKNTSPGPMIRSMEKRGEKLFFTFDNCGGGLLARETPYVSIVSDEGITRLPALIEGPDTLSVDISSVGEARKILYAWANNPQDRQLYNSEGLPVIPFRVVC